ncbi:MAG TPA: GNVR domain-containing protein [Polyangiales bacterium]|nr:GNVR domain-containing protein [Polyangiales bacterium]
MYPEEPADHLAPRSQHSAIRWTNAPQPPMQGPGQSHSRGDGIDLTQLWWMVRDNAGLVLAIAGLVFALAMYKCLTSPMTFLSTARLYMGESGAGAVGVSTELDIGSGVSADAAAEIEVLRSRSMVSAAALASGVNVSITQPEWEPPVMWRWLLSDRDPSQLDPASEIVGVTDTQLREGIIESRAYSLRFVSPTDYVLSGGEFGTAHGKLGSALSTPEVSVTLLPGPVGARAGTELILRVDPLDTTVERTQGQLGVTVPKTGSTQARVLVLTFASTNRRLAESFLTQLMRTYLEVRHAWKTEEASAAEDFVTDQLKSLRSSLDQTQEKLADYRTENKVVVMADEAQSIMQQVNRYEEQRVHAQLELSSLRDIREALKSSTLPVEAYMVGETHDEVLQRQAAALEEARARMTTLSSEYNEASPEIKRTDAQVKAQLTAIRSYVNAKIARAEKQVGALNKVISEHESKLATIPGAELAVSQLGRESEVYSRMYSFLLERRQQAAITKASTVSKNRILDTAYVPVMEDSPKLMLHLASSILGLLLGAAVVILRGLFSAVFRVENDVRGMLGPLQVFARIPARSRARFDPGTPAFDVMGGRLSPSYVEAFRSLRTNLYRALPGEHGKVILVTSPEQRDGKTSCALSLAAMLAADNRRVLVVDADVRKPSHHSLLGVPQEPGLADVVLRSGQAWRDGIRTMCLTSGSFDALCAGPETSAELLSDERFNRFLVQARSQYDFVILDGPSYPAVSDPLILGPLSDFVLSVVRLGHTSRRVAEEHLTSIFSESRGLAVALNDVQATMPSLLHSQAAPRLQGLRRLR